MSCQISRGFRSRMRFWCRFGIQLFEAPNNFFRRKFAAIFPLVQVPAGDDVIHRKNSWRHALCIDDGQASNLFFRNGAGGLVNFIVRLARENLTCGDLPDREVAGQAVVRAHGDADVAVGHDANKLAVVVC